MLCSLLALGLCLGAPPPGLPADPASTPGTAASCELVFGMSTALTGPAQNLGRNLLAGVQMGFERQNRSGGIAGKQLRVIALDDGYEPALTAPNMRRLLEVEGALGTIGNVGTPTASVAVPISLEDRAPFFAPLTGAALLRRCPPDRYVINYRAGYDQEIDAMMEALIKMGGLKPAEIAFLTQRDAFGEDCFRAGLAALRRHGLAREADLAHVHFERNTVAVESALADILSREVLPRAVVLVGPYAPCSRFIQLARASGLDRLFLCVSFVGSGSLAERLRESGVDSARVLVTQVVPHPEDATIPIVREHLDEAMLQGLPEAPSYARLEGYIAGRILCRALESIQGEISREAVVDALEGLGSFDLGLGEPLSLGPADHQASDRVWLSVLREGKFDPAAWEIVASLLQEPAR